MKEKTGSFNATVLRVDSLGRGWMSNIVVHWLAWLPRLPVAPTLVSAPSEEKAETKILPPPLAEKAAVEKVGAATVDQKKQKEEETLRKKEKVANVTASAKLRGSVTTASAKAAPAKSAKTAPAKPAPPKAKKAEEALTANTPVAQKEKGASDSVSTRPSLPVLSQVVHVFANATPPALGEPVAHVHATMAGSTTGPTTSTPATAATAPEINEAAGGPGDLPHAGGSAGHMTTHGTNHGHDFGGMRRQALSVSD